MTELVKLRLIICGFCLIFALLSATAGVFDVSIGSLIGGAIYWVWLGREYGKKDDNQ